MIIPVLEAFTKDDVPVIFTIEVPVPPEMPPDPSNRS